MFFFSQTNFFTYKSFSCVNHSLSYVFFFISLVLIIAPFKHKIIKMKWHAKKKKKKNISNTSLNVFYGVMLDI